MIGAADFIAPGKIAMAGIVVGALSGFGVAQLQPGPTLAAVIKDPPIHFSAGKALDTDLFRDNGNYYAVGHTPEVSMTPIATNVVRKVGLGRTSFVTVTTTATGTYSTDGLASSNVRYPGIYTEPLQIAAIPFAGTLLGWSRLTGWTEIPLLADRGWDLIDDTAPASRDGVCVSDAKVGCR
jgi:hypothetical protein